jgi:hypothetical protein
MTAVSWRTGGPPLAHRARRLTTPAADSRRVGRCHRAAAAAAPGDPRRRHALRNIAIGEAARARTRRARAVDSLRRRRRAPRFGTDERTVTRRRADARTNRREPYGELGEARWGTPITAGMAALRGDEAPAGVHDVRARRRSRECAWRRHVPRASHGPMSVAPRHRALRGLCERLVRRYVVVCRQARLGARLRPGADVPGPLKACLCVPTRMIDGTDAGVGKTGNRRESRGGRWGARASRRISQSSPGTWCKTWRSRSSVTSPAAQAAWCWAASSLILLSG